MLLRIIETSLASLVVLACLVSWLPVQAATHSVSSTDPAYKELLNLGAKEFHCVNYSCYSCLRLHVERIKLNETACLNLTYLVNDYGFEFTFSLDGYIIYREEISARNPPPVCFDIPYLKDAASICLKFHDLDYANKTMKGCADLVVKLAELELLKLKLGCFHLGPNKPAMSSFELWFGYVQSNELIVIKANTDQSNVSVLRSIVKRLARLFSKLYS